jgi:hypothetical protein
VDSEYLEKVLREGDPENKIGPIDITDDRTITNLSPYQYSECVYVFMCVCVCVCVCMYVCMTEPSPT